MPFVQSDSSAVEAVLVGHYMGGPAGEAYVELAKRGIHDWLVCRWLGWEFTPANKKRVKAEQAELRERMKRVVHGTGFGMGPFLMNKNDPEAFPTVAAAKQLQKFMFRSLPMLAPWQQQVRERAQQEGYLTNDWDFNHYFYDVFTFYLNETTGERVMDDVTGQWKIKNGKDGNRAIAFLPQSSNGAFQRDNINLLRISPLDLDEPITDLQFMRANWLELRRAAKSGETWQRYFPANLSVHDSLCLDVPWELVERAANTLLTIMTRAVPQLGGLHVGAECEVGDDWLHMTPVAAWPMLDPAKPEYVKVPWEA